MTADQMLGLLVRRVHEARSEVDRCRHGRVVREDLAAAHRELLRALQEYTTALERHALPVPPRLRAELRLHRDLFER
jgi:hypothetical protein